MTNDPSAPAFHRLGDWLLHSAGRFPEREALIFAEQRLTWADYWLRVGRLAEYLLSLGVQRGDRIAVWSPNRPEYLFTYLAAARIGAIIVGLNVQYTLREVIALAGQTEPVLLVLGPEMAQAAMVDRLAQALPSVRHFISLGSDPPAGVLNMAGMLADGRPEQAAQLAQRAAEIDEDDGLYIIFTGGSSGSPKGALLSHASILASAGVEAAHLGIRMDDRMLLHLPLNHASGATVLTVPAMLAGCPLVIMDRFQPQETLALVARERVTVLGQVPTMFIMQLGLPNLAEYNLSSLRLAIVAGAPTPSAVMARLRELAPLVFHGYGLTEASGFATFTAAGDDLATLTGTVGRPLPGVELRIVDELRRPLPTGQVGEVALRGRLVMRGYYGQPAETAAVLDGDGWLYTGDLGYLRLDGNLSLAGLKKEMFFTGGFNVYPLEIEQYVCEHPDVAFAACVGQPHEVLGQVGALFVVPKRGHQLSAADLRAYCKAGLARYKIPRQVTLLDALPLTAVGKVDKMNLHRLLPSGRSVGQAP
jgi:acyl-CoA synthetase (AMP-forming)/AMP-acid ligase II